MNVVLGNPASENKHILIKLEKFKIPFLKDWLYYCNMNTPHVILRCGHKLSVYLKQISTSEGFIGSVENTLLNI